MAKASQFTQYGTLDPAQDMLPFLKKVGGVYENAKVTATAAGIGQPDYSARSSADAARSQANAAQDVAETALAAAWFGTSAGAASNVVANVALSTAWAGTAAALQAQSVAAPALSTSWVGTSTAHEAYNVAKAALATAWVGTDAPTGQAEAAYRIGKTALETSWVGTSSAASAVTAAAAAYNIGQAGLTTSWTGTGLGAQAIVMATYAIGLTGTASSGGGGADLATAWAGTAAAREARAVAQTALETSWTGTGAASAAGVTAGNAYTLASAGTIGSITVAVSSGSVVFDMDGQVYQTVNITGDTVVSVTNAKPHTANRVQGITARLIGDGVAHNITCDNFEWMTDPLTTIGANKTVFMGMTAFGSTPGQVTVSALIEDTRFLAIDANSTASYKMGRAALDTSWVGTNAAREARAVAQTALETSWTGTSTGHESYDVAKAALETSWTGTASYGVTHPSAGTITFDMSGSYFQSATLVIDSAITVKNIQPPGQDVKSISARIFNNNTAGERTVYWDAFGVIGASLPNQVADNHSIFVSFTSFGSTVQNVFAAASKHI